jgi:hypothetical protein
VGAVRPWVLRALAMTLLYGVGQTVFVALSSRLVNLTPLWSALLLGVLLLVGLVWAGAEVIADRVPPEWTWLKASLVTGPAAGLLSWILLLSFVDSVGVEDLGASLVGRASFTVLLVLASVSVGSRLGWLSLRRSGDPRADEDPGADVDAPAEDGAGSVTTRSGEAGAPPVIAASTAERVAARRARRVQEREQREAGVIPGSSSPGSSSPGSSSPSAPAPARPAAPSPTPSRAPAAAGSRRSGARGDDPVRVPFGTGPFADPPSSPTPAASPTPSSGGGYASPVVAVLPPVTPLPAPADRAGTSDADDHEDHDGSDGRRAGGGRRRFGLRRPGSDTGPDSGA